VFLHTPKYLHDVEGAKKVTSCPMFHLSGVGPFLAGSNSWIASNSACAPPTDCAYSDRSSMCNFCPLSVISPSRAFMKIRPGAGRDPPPETRLDAWEFAAKSKTERRLVTLGPPRGCRSGGPRRPARGREPAQGGPGSSIRKCNRGGGARGGPRHPPRNTFGSVGI
jgi:hypothetical protein